MKASVYLGDTFLKSVFLDGVEFTIGRSSECELSINSPAVSRKHCNVQFLEDKYILTDLGGANGVSVMGDRLKPKGTMIVPISLSFEIANNIRIHLDKTEKTSSLITKSVHKVTKEKSKKTSTPKTKKHFGTHICVFFIFVLFALLNNFNLKVEEPVIDEKKILAQINKKRTVPLKPLSSKKIEEQLSSLNCNQENKSICQKLYLNAAKGEGAMVKENYAIIALKLDKNKSPEQERIDIIRLGMTGLNPIVKNELKNKPQIYVVGLREGEKPIVSYMPNHETSYDEFDSNMKNLILSKKIELTYEWNIKQGVRKINDYN